ncbi:MAG TPA: glycosyltransferase family 39 protein [Methylococcaceae bacterium]|nr:glycosyltransferase family 39 protein [Methylococcaceae bacterium]
MRNFLGAISTHRPFLIPALLWLIVLVVALWSRPLLPIDETRAVTVAWEMWLRGDFLVPYLNGEPYSHKPPLLQWGTHLGWWLFGVNDWTPRLVAPLFGLFSLFLVQRIALRLWPEQHAIAALAPLVLLALPLWATWSTLTLYDIPIGAFVLLAVLGVLRTSGGERGGWALTGLALTGALLSKGPVVLIFFLPPALAAPWWRAAPPPGGWRRWYAGLAFACLLGIALALCWAVPAAAAGGEEYGRAILWGQFAGRVAHSFAHQKPWWWYVPILPLMLLPWIFWPTLWKSAARLRCDAGVRFCLALVVPALLVFSLISGKQVHYLLPLLPFFALLAARALADNPAITSPFRLWGMGVLFLLLGGAGGFVRVVEWWHGEMALPAYLRPWLEDIGPLWMLAMLGLGGFWLTRRGAAYLNGARLFAVASFVLLAMAHLAFRQVQFDRWDIEPLARRVAEKQAAGLPVAQNSEYHGDLHFLGRLRQPLFEARGDTDLRDWALAHPDGYVVLHFSPDEIRWPVALADYTQGYRSKMAGLWKARVIGDWLRGRE